jgi:hypothetical protein
LKTTRGWREAWNRLSDYTSFPTNVCILFHLHLVVMSLWTPLIHDHSLIFPYLLYPYHFCRVLAILGCSWARVYLMFPMIRLRLCITEKDASEVLCFVLRESYRGMWCSHVHPGEVNLDHLGKCYLSEFSPVNLLFLLKMAKYLHKTMQASYFCLNFAY